MRLDRDSKQPIWLGLVLIFAAFIFTLFFITRVQASDLSAYDYNNVLLVQFSGATIEFCFADGSFGFRRNIGYEYTDGVPVITQDELENNLDGVFAYLLPSETIVLLFDNYAAAGPYLDTKSFFAQRGCAVLDYSGSFPLDVSGFSLSKINAGTWFIPYYTRSVSLTPTATPSPTPELSSEIVSILVKGDGYWNSSVVSSNQYYLFDFEITRFGSVDISSINNNAFNLAVSNYGVDNPWVRDALIYTVNYGQLRLAFYFSGSIVSCTKYSIGSSLSSSDFGFIRSHYDPVSVSSGSDIHWEFSDPLSGGFIWLENTASFVKCSPNFNILEFSGLYQDSDFSTSLFRYASSSVNVSLVQGYRVGLSGSSVPSNPDASPTPSPSPSPTDAPYVNINWPSGTPSPSPPVSVPLEDSGGGSGSPGGSSQGSLTPGQVNSTLNTFKQYTQNNGAFAFLYACTGLIPDDALYFLFILLFILLLLACLRLFVHFTGG